MVPMYRDQDPRLQRSPPLTLRPLRPPPCAPPIRPQSLEDTEENPNTASRIFARVVEKPFPDPHETLCRLYNVARISIKFRKDSPAPSEINVPVLQDAHMPTHILAILDTPGPPESTQAPAYAYPHLAPINAELFAAKFTNDVTRLSSHLAAPGTTLPIPFWDKRTQSHVVKLPVIPLTVPHPISVPLLLLFGLGLHLVYSPDDILPRVATPDSVTITSSNSESGHSSHPHPPHPTRRRSSHADLFHRKGTGLLATYLLPTPVIEEFPSGPAMADKMAKMCRDEELQTFFDYNQGLWRNTLSLAPKDTDIIDIVRIAWNVTAEAKRIRDRQKER